MLGYSTAFRKESRIIAQANLIYACNTSSFYLMTVVLSFVTFSTYVGLGNTLDPQKVFTSLLLLNAGQLFYVCFLIFFLLQTSELSVSLKRIEVNVVLMH